MQQRKPSKSSPHKQKGRQEEHEDEEEDQQEKDRRVSRRNGKQNDISLSQSSQRHDPKQDQAERRALRKNYRNLATVASDQRDELIQLESDTLENMLNDCNTLYEEVRNPREAALDSEVLVVIAQRSVEKIQRIDPSLKTYDPSDFIVKLRAKYPKGHTDDTGASQGGERSLDWKAIGNGVSKFFKTTSCPHFMYGPLDIEPTQKKPRARIQRQEKVGEAARPELLEKTGLDGDKESSRRIQRVKETLENANKTDFFQFILDRNFGKTVENLFHFSFLVKDGHAKLTADKATGRIEAEPADPPDQNDYQQKKAQKRQSVLTLDYNMWQTLQEKFGEGPLTAYNKKVDEEWEQMMRQEQEERVPDTQQDEEERRQEKQKGKSRAKTKEKAKGSRSKHSENDDEEHEPASSNRAKKRKNIENSEKEDSDEEAAKPKRKKTK